MKNTLLAGSIFCGILAVVIFAVAWSVGTALPPAAPTGTAQVLIMKVRVRETVIQTALPTKIPTSTSTTIGPCWWGGKENSLCTWPTATQILPIPDCPPPTPASGQICRWTYLKVDQNSNIPTQHARQARSYVGGGYSGYSSAVALYAKIASDSSC
jgi:hypothetical protein